jgi:hypothetical protein
MQQGNVSAIATYLTQSGKRRIFRCHTCATHFSETRETVFFDLRTSEEKVMIALSRDDVCAHWQAGSPAQAHL